MTVVARARPGSAHAPLGAPAARARAVAALMAASAVAVVAVVLLWVPPAGAHRGGPAPTDFRATIVEFDPGVSGIAVRAVDGDGGLELVNESDRTVVVAGYEGEPYLRLDPDGVFHNVRSPAVYLNRSALGDVTPPPHADAGAPPRWEQISPGRTARWHDHRAHWMNPFDPPTGRAPGGAEVVAIERWVVPVTVDARPAPIVGQLRWAPPPDPTPWLGAAAMGTLALVSVGWWWRRDVLLVALAAALVAAVGLDVVGVAAANGDGPAQVVSTLPGAVAALVVLGMGVALLGRHRRGALVAVAFGSAVLALEFGYLSLSYLERSQLPSDLPAWLSRATVLVAVAAGTAATTTAVGRLSAK